MKLPWIIVLALLALVVYLMLTRPSTKIDVTPFQNRIKEQQSKIDSLTQSNRARFKRIQEDSIIQVEERKSFIERYTTLKSKLGKHRVRIDTIIQESPEVARYVELADSTITHQALRIDQLEGNISELRVNIQDITSNFQAQLAAEQEKFKAQEQISGSYQKEAKSEKRKVKVWKILTIVGTVGGLFLGSQ